MNWARNEGIKIDSRRATSEEQNVATLLKKKSKYSVVDKEIRGPRINSTKTESRLIVEKEWEERRAPTMMSYAPKEDITKADIPAIKFP